MVDGTPTGVVALLCPQDLKPKDSRSPRSGTWEPPGYVSAKDRQRKYIFNRSHIFADRFNGKWIKENIFTGFTDMNASGMKRCENRMAEALDSRQAVLYSGQLLYGNGRKNLPTGIRMTAVAPESDSVQRRTRGEPPRKSGDVLMLATLERILPQLRSNRALGGRGINWARIENELGTRLPSDFVELAEAYPPFSIDDFLSLHIPEPGDERFFVEGVRETLGVLADFRESGMSHTYAPYPELGGLLPWGDSCDGDVFYWRTTGQHPDSWTILVSGRNDDWCEYQGTLTEYLAGLISGAVAPEGLPPDFPSEFPSVDFD